MSRLSRAELAAEADATPGRIDELVRIGVLHPGADGAFGTSDATRVRIVGAYEAAGIDLELIALAIDRRWTTFERTEEVYPDRGLRSSRTVREFRAALGARGSLLASTLAALGLPAPDDDARLSARDEEVLASFLAAWDIGSDPGVVVRAARLAGQSMQRTVDGWLELFAEHVTRRLEERTVTVDESVPLILPRASAIIADAPELLEWLFHRHLETGLDAANTASMEVGLAREGLLPPRRAEPETIVFVDLAGFTRLTETGGDQLAAESAARLAELADATARPRDGRLVKLLGDGAMLHFRRARAAVEAALELVDAIRDAGLPPGHAGISAGPLVSRDGDYFGHTVNLAARLSGAAEAGDVLATRELVEAVGDDRAGVRFEPVGAIALKNVSDPVMAFRVLRAG